MKSALDIFNACEAALWFAMAAAVIFRYRRAIGGTRRIAFGLALFLVLFAASDLIEMRTGAWWRPVGLLVLKTICVIGLVGCFGLLWRHSRQ
ncbi:MAG: hypothetical protein HY290_28380 [Planctomycetia bacterium]|nr:hypothetical protein [Planctomycetia bacterium]